MARRPLTVPTSGTVAQAEDYGNNPTPLAVWVTPDGVVVGGPGAWQQLSSLLPQAYAANWAVPDWYIDGVIGLDTNNGTTALTPLRTGVELLRRLGPYALWGQSVTVHVLANGMVDGLILRGALPVAGTHLDIIGATTLLYSDTVLTYTNLSHAVPSTTQVVAALLADWTPYAGRRIRFTTTDAAVWIGLVNPGGAGLQIAQTTRAARIDPANINSIYNTAAVNPAPGDPLVVESLPAVPSIALHLDGPTLRTPGAKYPARQWLISSVACPQIDLSGLAVKTLSKAGIWGCEVGIIASLAESSAAGNMSQKAACKVSSADLSGASNVINLGGNWFCSLFASTESQVPGGTYFSASYGLWQATTLWALAGSSVNLQDCQVFDVPGAASMAFYVQGYAGLVTNISGARNAGYGFCLRNNATLRVTGTTNIQGAVSNGRLVAAPATNLTLPQLLQPSDYAQKGTTAAMVAGVGITVTVPWYDNVNQKVTATHAVFAGTPGVLAVAQISTTQFTVTSSAALDTSTVNWTISPLGRNIFITTA